MIEFQIERGFNNELRQPATGDYWTGAKWDELSNAKCYESMAAAEKISRKLEPGTSVWAVCDCDRVRVSIFRCVNQRALVKR
jgi:hypothetical protein